MNHGSGVDVVTLDANGSRDSGKYFLAKLLRCLNRLLSVSEVLGSDASVLAFSGYIGCLAHRGWRSRRCSSRIYLAVMSALSVGKSPSTGNGSPGLLPQGGGGWLGPSIDVPPNFLLPATGGSGQFSRVNGIYGGGENGVNMGSWITYEVLLLAI